VIELLKQGSAMPEVSLMTRLRVDAALYDPAPPRRPGQNGRPRKKGARRPPLHQGLKAPSTRWTQVRVNNWYEGGGREVEVYTDPAVWYHTGLPPVPVRWLLSRDPPDDFEPQALVTPHLAQTPEQRVEWFVRRWTREGTFAEARAPLGLETQRQWNDQASGRTTPALFGLYSLVTVMAPALQEREAPVVRTAAWDAKACPTFSDALAVVCREVWSACHFTTSGSHGEMVKIPRSVLERLTDTVCYAA